MVHRQTQRIKGRKKKKWREGEHTNRRRRRREEGGTTATKENKRWSEVEDHEEVHS